MSFIQSLKIRKLYKSIDKYPDIFKNYRELIEALLRDDKVQEAESVLRKCLEKQWTEEETTWLHLKRLQMESRSRAAVELLKPALELLESITAKGKYTGDIVRVTARIISQALQSGKLPVEESRAVAETAGKIRSLPEDPEQKVSIGMLIAESLSAAGQDSDAFNEYKKLVELAEAAGNPEVSWEVFTRCGRLAETLNFAPETILPFYQKALNVQKIDDARMVELLTKIGDLLSRSGDMLGAMEKYETALRFLGREESGVAASIRFKLAKNYFQSGRVPQALKEADTALKCSDLADEFIVEVMLWKAEALQLQQKFDDAASVCKEALALAGAPGLQQACHLRMASIHRDMQAYGEAVSSLLAAKELAPESTAEIDLQLAELYLLTDEPHRTLKIVSKLRETAGDGEAARRLDFLEAEALLKQTKTIRALEKYLDIIENTPESHEMHQSARKRIFMLKRELDTEEGRKKYRIDSMDRKKLANLLARSPEEDDFFTRLRKGLMKTKAGFVEGIEKILSKSGTVDETVLDELEELLILSDLGVDTTMKIMDSLREKLAKSQLKDAEFIKSHIRSEIEAILSGAAGSILPKEDVKPYVIMMVGVNGVGKTTTIAKIARRFKDMGKHVLLAAGDTFRAGAIEQLQEWGRRLEVEVISQQEGSDPSAVAWDAVAAAKSRDADILIVDTAGRLHTKSNLMEELKKVYRVLGKNMPGAPHETLLVLDATNGQNALQQAKLFKEAVDVTGIALTKLDGTAKGGIIVAIADTMNIPVKLIGIGERMDDLRDFEPEMFASALFED